MTDPVSEVFVIRPVTRIGDHLPSSRIDIFTCDTRASGLQCRGLRAFDDVEHLELLISRFPKDRRASYIRCVVLDAAPAVHQHNVTRAKLLRVNGSVRESRVFCEQNQRPASCAHLLMSRSDRTRQLVLSHPHSQSL